MDMIDHHWQRRRYTCRIIRSIPTPSGQNMQRRRYRYVGSTRTSRRLREIHVCRRQILAAGGTPSSTSRTPAPRPACRARRLRAGKVLPGSMRRAAWRTRRGTIARPSPAQKYGSHRQPPAPPAAPGSRAHRLGAEPRGQPPRRRRALAPKRAGSRWRSCRPMTFLAHISLLQPVHTGCTIIRWYHKPSLFVNASGVDRRWQWCVLRHRRYDMDLRNLRLRR